MALQSISDGETGAAVRGKLNENFADIDGRDASGWILQPLKMDAGAIIGTGQGGVALSTLAGVANAIRVAPISFPRDTVVDQVGLSISTAVAAALFRVLIFAADADGRPGALLAESPNIDAATTGTKLVALSASFTFEAGKTYWVGDHSSLTATRRVLGATGTPVLSWSTAATPAANYTLARAATFGAPGNWPAFANNQASANLPPLVLFRRA